MKTPVLTPLCLCLLGCNGHVYLRELPDGAPVEVPAVTADAMISPDRQLVDAGAPDANIDATVIPPDAAGPDAQCNHQVQLRTEPPLQPYTHTIPGGTMRATGRVNLGPNGAGVFGGLSGEHIEPTELLIMRWDAPVTGLRYYLAGGIDRNQSGGVEHRYETDREVRYHVGAGVEMIDVAGPVTFLELSGYSSDSVRLGMLSYSVCGP